MKDLYCLLYLIVFGLALWYFPRWADKKEREWLHRKSQNSQLP